MTTNDLVKAGFYFRLLDSDFNIWKFRDISKGDTLIVLRELDLTTSIVTSLTVRQVASVHAAHVAAVGGFITAATAVAAASATTTAAELSAYWKVYGQAKTEFEKTGMIKGFEVLNPRTFQKLWISSYDMKALE